MIRPKPTFLAMFFIGTAMIVSLWAADRFSAARKARPGILGAWERRMPLRTRSFDGDKAAVVAKCNASSHATVENEKGTAHLVRILLPENVQSCLNGGKDAGKCLSIRIDRLIAQASAEVNFRDPGACIRKNDLPVVRGRVSERIGSELTRLTGTSGLAVRISEAIRQIELDLASQVDSKEAYLHCFRSGSPEACYRTALTQAFDQTARRFAPVLIEYIPPLRYRFLLRNPFRDAEMKMNRLFVRASQEAEKEIQQKAGRLWTQCAGAKQSECFRSAAFDDVKQLIDAFARERGLPLADSDLRAYVQSIWLSAYLNFQGNPSVRIPSAVMSRNDE